MPTDKPRYTVTDVGRTAELLDDAHRAWPEVTDRRRLLLRLVEAGGDAVRERLASEAHAQARQREVLARAERYVDVDVLLGDTAWS